MEVLAWHTRDSKDVEKALETGKEGLAASVAKERLTTYGRNAFPEKKPDTLLRIFIRQFESPLIYLLIIAAVVIFFTEGPADAYIIVAILLFNAIAGAIQEGKAQNTLAALKSFATTNATVIRDGKELLIPDTDVVPGDVIVLEEGMKVPADARVISSRALRIDEAALTGESEPVEKVANTLTDEKATVADQKNMAFKGTHVAAGGGTAIVVATGLQTVLGKIAKELTTSTEIPLQAAIRRLSNIIIVGVGIGGVLLFGLGIMLGHSMQEMFATVITLAVSVIPEGLPIVMTLVLAAGVWRMSKRQALVKNLQAVEALGQAAVIAVDKTGTLTKNEQVVQKVYTEGKTFSVAGVGYDPVGEVSLEGKVVDPANHPELLHAGKVAAYTATARVSRNEEAKQWLVHGDPTEAALIVLSEKLGFNKEHLEQESPVLGELPFTSAQRYHATVHAGTRAGTLSVAGAPEFILKESVSYREGEKSHPMTNEKRKELEEVMLALSSEGLRVLAFAERAGVSSHAEKLSAASVAELTFLGFYGMKDGLKAEVPEALQAAHDAGIRVVMITGDHVATAEAIGREANIYKEGDRVLTGTEIDTMSDEALSDALAQVSVFARVTPEHKLRIIKAYRARGETVAMTGDGINDAPSLAAADLGVAMGKVGTEVAKEASDIILLDDNFGSIVSAVEEGRGIYRSIQKVVLYLFSTSAGEAFAITLAILVGLPVPVLPAQIIWLNFVTDGFLTLALAMEPKEKGLLREKFKKPGKYLLDKTMTFRLFFMGTIMAIGSVWLFELYLDAGIEKALTISLTTLAVYQWFNAWNCRSRDASVFSMNPFGNIYLVGATLLVIVLQILAVHTVFLGNILHTVPLTPGEWLVCILMGSTVLIAEEIRKVFVRLGRSYVLKPA